jgi:hypothetical protein
MASPALIGNIGMSAKVRAIPYEIIEGTNSGFAV